MARVQLEYPDEIFAFSTELDVRFDDINIGAHMGFDKLVTLVTEARSRYLEWLAISEVASPGVIVTDLAVTYRSEARLRDRLRIDVGVAERSRVGGDIAYRVVRPADGTVIAIAKTGIVFFDYDTGRVAPAVEAFPRVTGREPGTPAAG